MLARYLVAGCVWEHSAPPSPSRPDGLVIFSRRLSGAFAWVGRPVFLPVFYLLAFTLLRLLLSQSAARFAPAQRCRLQ